MKWLNIEDIEGDDVFIKVENIQYIIQNIHRTTIYFTASTNEILNVHCGIPADQILEQINTSTKFITKVV